MCKIGNSNRCFDRATPIVYRETIDGPICVDPLRIAYEKHKDDEIFVCVIKFDTAEHQAVLTWKKAKMCHTKTTEYFVIYMEPLNFINDTELESDNVIRVTPGHVFPTLTLYGYKDTKASELKAGDKLIVEKSRIYGENESPLFLEDGEVAIEDILMDGSNHFVNYRHIAKVERNVLADAEWDFYGITFDDEESQYFMLCNSVISKKSDVND